MLQTDLHQTHFLHISNVPDLKQSSEIAKEVKSVCKVREKLNFKHGNTKLNPERKSGGRTEGLPTKIFSHQKSNREDHKKSSNHIAREE